MFSILLNLPWHLKQNVFTEQVTILTIKEIKEGDIITNPTPYQNHFHFKY